MSWLLTLLLNSLALLIADALVPGFRIEGIFSAFLAALVLGLVNTFIRPVLILFTLPITILTLGFFIIIINAFVFIIASWIVPGFYVYSFWGAFWGAIITSLASWLLNSISTREL
ncbi:MAG TPA: phage holin family protein [Bacillota bacterium]|jgi:putative membrane protein|nr:phage holin family protein [Peptococcaceae bacterium MAG4]NLW38507.1 phage holin family protein [Peptococcaceae bacterium]HPU35363.1 phage holin family protein [Bacillota bacterium]HPZ43271.1 phage holin family protein [Bacillota bacterium]HQD75858.1 phage holin family protein [Bacillota bacterium]